MLDRGFGPVHDVPDQLGMLRSVCKSAYRVHSADSALGLLMHAAAEALTPPMGPVSVEIPIDIQSMTIERPALLDQFALPLPAALSPTPAAMDTLAKRVLESKRPLLWTGGGARHAGDAVARLARMGIPVATSWNGRGVLPEDHPLVIGPLATLPEFERLYESVDLMLVAGCRLPPAACVHTRHATAPCVCRRIACAASATNSVRTLRLRYSSAARVWLKSTWRPSAHLRRSIRCRVTTRSSDVPWRGLKITEQIRYGCSICFY